MSTVTKIFVVLVSLFAFVFTPMTIQFVAQTHDWKRLAETYQEAAFTSQVHNRNLIAMSLAEKQALDDELQAMQAALREAQASHATTERTLAECAAQNARLETERLGLDARVAVLENTVKVLTDQNQVLTASNNKLTEDHNVLMTRNVDLNDRVRDLSAQLLVREQKFRMLEEENLAIRQENERLRQGAATLAAQPVGPVGPVPGVQPVTPAAMSPIRGQIMDVQGNTAQIDVGSASGVQKGMIFVVMRDGKYLGDLRIEEMEPSSAVGKLELTGQGVIRKGDAVRDKASLEREGR